MLNFIIQLLWSIVWKNGGKMSGRIVFFFQLLNINCKSWPMCWRRRSHQSLKFCWQVRVNTKFKQRKKERLPSIWWSFFLFLFFPSSEHWLPQLLFGSSPDWLTVKHFMTQRLTFSMMPHRLVTTIFTLAGIHYQPLVKVQVRVQLFPLLLPSLLLHPPTIPHLPTNSTLICILLDCRLCATPPFLWGLSLLQLLPKVHS